MSRYLFDLSDRVAIVTGGGRGIGRAIAEGLAVTGVDVVPTACTRADVEAAVSAVRLHGSESLEITTDVTEPDAVEDLIERTVSEFSNIDIVINNAGINPETACLTKRKMTFAQLASSASLPSFSRLGSTLSADSI